MYKKKTKTKKIAVIVVMAMLLQVTGLLSLNVYATDDSFKVVERIDGDKAFVDWEFKLYLDNPIKDFSKELNFTTTNPQENQDLIGKDGTKIGTYSINENGELSVVIDGRIYRR